MSVRTLLLVIRGIAQTSGAHKKATADMDDIEKGNLALKETANRLLFGGAAFLVLGLTLAKTMVNIMATTYGGQAIMERLSIAWRRFNAALGAKIVDKHGDKLEALSKFLVKISRNDALISGVIDIGVPVILGLMSIGVMSFIGGFANSIVANVLIGLIRVVLGKEAAKQIFVGTSSSGGLSLTIPILIILSVTLGAIWNLDRLEKITSMPDSPKKDTLLSSFPYVEGFDGRNADALDMWLKPDDITINIKELHTEEQSISEIITGIVNDIWYGTKEWQDIMNNEDS